METPGLQSHPVSTEVNQGAANELGSGGNISRRRAVVIAVILGILKLVQDYFHASDKEAGLLNTVYLCGVVAFSPVFGFLGDRFSRKILLSFGIILWSSMAFIGSLMKKDQFWIFFATRGLLGIGQASFATLYPPIISDLFVGDARSKAITILNAVIPLGVGGGILVGADVAYALGGWQWSLRVTPPIGLLCAFLCLFLIKEPKRGASESHTIKNYSKSVLQQKSTYLEDLHYLLHVKSYLLVTFGSACYYFGYGAISFWGATFMYDSAKLDGTNLTQADTGEIIGISLVISGFVGIILGGVVARWYRRFNPSGDALLIAWAGIIAAPGFFLTLWVADKLIPVSLTLEAVVMIFGFIPYAPTMDLLLYVIVPTRRSSALGVHNVVGHVLGDALTSVIIGAISDGVRGGDTSLRTEQRALMYGNFLPVFVLVIGAALFFLCSLYVPGDRQRAEALTKGTESPIDDSDRHLIDAGTQSDDCTETDPLLSGRHRSPSYGRRKELTA